MAFAVGLLIGRLVRQENSVIGRFVRRGLYQFDLKYADQSEPQPKALILRQGNKGYIGSEKMSDDFPKRIKGLRGFLRKFGDCFPQLSVRFPQFGDCFPQYKSMTYRF